MRLHEATHHGVLDDTLRRPARKRSADKAGWRHRQPAILPLASIDASARGVVACGLRKRQWETCVRSPAPPNGPQSCEDASFRETSRGVSDA